VSPAAGAASAVTGVPRGVPLLEPALMARLERLQLGTRRRLAGRFVGDHRSRRHGSSLDFADFREYTAGDDLRRLDPNLYARLGLLAIRLFEAEDDVTVRLLVDASASMRVGGKLRQAQRVAAALGFLSLVRRDAVEVRAFPAPSRPARFVGRSSTPALFAHLARLPAGGATAFGAAVGEVLARPGAPGVTVVISDLLTEDWEHALGRIAGAGGELAVVQVLAREELDPDLVGDMDLIDAETGASVPVSASPYQARAYREALEAFLTDVQARSRKLRAGYALVPADADLEQELLKAWRRQGLLR
jgi:uncharacterized protein (DUF58 family)